MQHTRRFRTAAPRPQDPALLGITIIAMAVGVVVALALTAVGLAGCSGDVNVHGVPDKIELEAPFCVPSKDAGAAGASDAGADG